MAKGSFLRQSQVVASFGPGALVDLPEHPVIVGWLGTWKGQHMLPVRFVCGCKRGHIDDIGWHATIHGGERAAPALLIETIGCRPLRTVGEGLFIQLDPARSEKWLERPVVQARARRLGAGFARWAAERGVERTFPDGAYVMVYTLAHLLLAAIAEECGYPASALQKQMFSPGRSRFGVLLYTATPGANGTVGGLWPAPPGPGRLRSVPSPWRSCTQTIRSARAVSRTSRTATARCTARRATAAFSLPRPVASSTATFSTTA